MKNTNTFVVKIVSQQNSTWTEEKKVQNFRSALELLKLISGALDEGDIEAEGGNHEK